MQNPDTVVRLVPNPERKSGGGNPPGDDELNARVAALEKSSFEIREKLVRVEMRLDSIESNMATKADLATLASKDDMNGFVRSAGKDIQDLAVSFQKAITGVEKSIADATWRFVQISLVLAGLAFTAAKFIH
ncbi:hypothetical protein K5E40_03740 [Pseudomonas baetica]|uniref:hypothetical protein n=1 Tax=Pseudomonas baetica TaxID=674054 RepID=UPI001C8C1213|nr:hypothetical protein [Pseudomonas baetica]MBX9404787.1 hypothetical protein [Pseudomonas baetica]